MIVHRCDDSKIEKTVSADQTQLNPRVIPNHTIVVLWTAHAALKTVFLENPRDLGQTPQ